jgi:hypothetical protein
VGNTDDAWVIIRRFDDPVEAETTRQFLRDHDIPVSMLGNSGATSILNRFNTVLDIRLTVPAARLEEAKEALEALVASLPDHPFRGKVPMEEAEALVKQKSPAAAFILACLVPFGGGHFYAQHAAAGTVLAAGIVGGYVGAIVGSRPVLFAAACCA